MLAFVDITRQLALSLCSQTILRVGWTDRQTRARALCHLISSIDRSIALSRSCATPFPGFAPNSKFNTGYDNGEAITSSGVVSILTAPSTTVEQHLRLEWNPVWREHVMSYRGRDSREHLATFPTLPFIQVRVVCSLDEIVWSRVLGFFSALSLTSSLLFCFRFRLGSTWFLPH